MLVSIIIRTLNEEQYLADLLTMISLQKSIDVEVVENDSGSTDDTREIAEKHGARITMIPKPLFSFGRSLNWGSDFANGDILVYISGHCIPVNEHWIKNLCQPLIEGKAAYSYGRQVGDDDSFYSERRIFAKYFPRKSAVPQKGFFCNNANSAILRDVWQHYRFDEQLTGLEDLALAKNLTEDGLKVAYVAESPVFHHHSESWGSVQQRFEREALALQQIMPEVNLTRFDVLRYVLSSIWMDWQSAAQNRTFARQWYKIIRYRAAQYYGSYIGNNKSRRLSERQKERFFYPAVKEVDTENEWLKSYRRTSPFEGKQSKGEG
jgi:glycosyltransferase involved in cell wall biosynthesis